MGDAATEGPLGAAQPSERGAEMRRQRGEIIRTPIRQGGFRPVPHALVGVQLGGVGWEELHVQPWDGAAEVADHRASVDPPVVPQDNHRPPQVAKQVAKEGADRRLADVRAVQLVIEPEAAAAGTDRHAGNHGDSVVPLPEAQERRLPPRRPGLADTGDQQEARFVEEDEVGAQPRSVFFTRGHSRRFHWAMRASSRSSARASGF